MPAHRFGDESGWELSLGGRPVVREKFGDPGDGVVGDARQDILEPGERVDAHSLTGGRETAQHRGRLAALIATEEDPVVAADRHTTDRAFGGVMPTPGLCRVDGIRWIPHCLHDFATLNWPTSIL